MFDKKDDFDSFWDVSKLVPKKKPSMTRFSTSEKTEEVIIYGEDPAKNARAASERKLSFGAYEASRQGTNAKLSETSYVPSNSRLIKRVTIKPSIDRFDFYDTFRKAALIYYEYKCGKCDFVPFYSYKPQYSQMNIEQKKYYFYWRDEVRKSRYLKTDYSYIYLYAYEILNLPERIGREEGIRLLIDVWKAYRRELPGIDQNFAAWVQDYCLVYQLPCPFESIKDFLFDVINVSPFKEFYLSASIGVENSSAAMLAYLSDYDWRKGKYAGGDSADIYRMHVEGAMQRVFAKILNDDIVKKNHPVKISRTAFPGSLCTHSVKCILELEYYSISDSPELRGLVTASLKHTENKLRACLGVKSRLAVKDLTDDLRGIIDKYFETELLRLRKEQERANQPEYERLYDAVRDDISLEDAMKIEKASWQTTAKLVEGIEDYDAEATVKAHDAPQRSIDFTAEKNPSVKSAQSDRYGLSYSEIEFIRAALNGDNAAEVNISKECGAMRESVAEKINEVFADNFGDVILEESDGGYKVIDDYCEEIEEWLI